MDLLLPDKLRLTVHSALHGEWSETRAGLPSKFIRACQVNYATLYRNSRPRLFERNGSCEDTKTLSDIFGGRFKQGVEDLVGLSHLSKK